MTDDELFEAIYNDMTRTYALATGGPHAPPLYLYLCAQNLVPLIRKLMPPDATEVPKLPNPTGLPWRTTPPTAADWPASWGPIDAPTPPDATRPPNPILAVQKWGFGLLADSGRGLIMSAVAGFDLVDAYAWISERERAEKPLPKPADWDWNFCKGMILSGQVMPDEHAVRFGGQIQGVTSENKGLRKYTIETYLAEMGTRGEAGGR